MKMKLENPGATIRPRDITRAQRILNLNEPGARFKPENRAFLDRVGENPVVPSKTPPLHFPDSVNLDEVGRPAFGPTFSPTAGGAPTGATAQLHLRGVGPGPAADPEFAVQDAKTALKASKYGSTRTERTPGNAEATEAQLLKNLAYHGIEDPAGQRVHISPAFKAAHPGLSRKLEEQFLKNPPTLPEDARFVVFGDIEERWSKLDQQFKVGEVVSGVVTQCLRFGAFVRLAPGIEGLVPLSEMSYTKRVLKADELVKPGDTIHVLIKEIHLDERKILLSLKDASGDPCR